MRDPECLCQMWNAMQLRTYIERVPLRVRIVQFKSLSNITYLGCTFCKKRFLFAGICRFCLHECPKLKPFYRLEMKVDDKSCCLTTLAWESTRDFLEMTAAEFACLRSEGREKPLLDRLLGQFFVVTFSIARSAKGPYIGVDSAHPVTENVRDSIECPSRLSSEDNGTTAHGEFSFTRSHVSDVVQVDSEHTDSSQHSSSFVVSTVQQSISRDF